MGHPALSRPAAAVDDPTAPTVRRLLDDMADTLANSGGVGLAAPQIGVSVRVVLVDIPAARSEEATVRRQILINPELHWMEEAQEEAWEACLSLPELTGRVPRFRCVGYEGLNADGRLVAGIARGFHARVLQHECDHLNGVLYPMRMRDLSRFGFVEEMRPNGDVAERENWGSRPVGARRRHGRPALSG